jgi:polyvinyl alcohol dehydrogenase (cytochrome)
MRTGKMLWFYQGVENDASPAGCNGRQKGEQCPEHVGPDWDFANSPILKTLPGGKRVLIAAPKGGGVAALGLADGKKAWFTKLDPAPAEQGRRPRRGQTAAVTAIPGVVFSGGWDGVLHALATTDGHQLWEYNTAQDYKTVNGIAAKGGSLGDPGPVIVGGMLYVGSGYIGTGNGMPGNVLLAFSAQ